MATVAPNPSAIGREGSKLSRRQPAHRALSIRHHPLAQDAGKEDSSVSPPSLQNNQGSSGESTNPDKWFTKSNENVGRHGTAFVDSESPFEIDEFEGSPVGFSGIPKIHLPQQTLNSHGSSSEEYRSVIDDLTIQNQKLKKRLKKFQVVKNSPLQADRLFEVRVHGLPASKKQELEDLLARFAQNVNQSPSSGGSSERLAVPPEFKKPSSMSSTRFADSGYGSLPTSNLPSATSFGVDRLRSTQAEASVARDNNIHSYLHDIPEGLLPRHPKAMTEKAKKKLVVRRLEQIFGGRGATPGVHQQPLQQQEVSQSAAHADRTEVEAQGGVPAAEGIREAKIMQKETEDPMDYDMESNKPKPNTDDKQMVSEKDHIHIGSPYPDQRPTRPLDLDPDRAQDPSENIEYIRHLGFELPNMTDHRPAADGQGWIYLNLLVNMAQLHTINVTADFVKKAVSEYSTKFELASDGRKIRWRGGSSNVSPPDGSSNSVSGIDQSPLSPDEKSNKRPRPAYLESEESTSGSGHINKRQVTPIRKSRVAYKPMFPPKTSEEDTDADMADDSSDISSPLPEDVTGESSGTKHSSSHSKRRDDGPIIFYNNAKFYTDLSGQKQGGSPQKNPVPTAPTPQHALGIVPTSSDTPMSIVHEPSRPLLQTPALSTDAMSVDSMLDMDSSASISITNVSPKRVTFAEPDRPIRFEASGIGGVVPKDNIAIKVSTQTIQLPLEKAPTRRPPPWLQGVLSKPPMRLRYAEKVLRVQTVELPPSELPPASMPFDEDDDSDAASETSDFSINAPSDSVSVPSSADSTTQRAGTRVRDGMSPVSTRPIPPESSNSTSLGDDEDSGESGQGGVDFLASARQVNPDVIRAKEREYDAEMADRLADEIPAGSSAATAGGGSGFNSPNSDVEGNKGKAQKKRKPVVASHEMEVDEDDDDEDDDDDDQDEDENGPERSISS